MGFWIGRARKARRAYGFDEVAIVPGDVTINPDEVDISWELKGKKYDVPIIAAAMDGVVSPKFSILMGQMGGMAMLNLEGVWTRYSNAEEILQEIAEADVEKATQLVQQLYVPPIKDDLISQRIEEIKNAGVTPIVSSTPQRAEKIGQIAVEAGAEIFVVQSTVSTVRHISTAYKALDLAKFIESMPIAVIVGNTVTDTATLEIMEAGADAVLVGIGPGAACTTRGVLGLGVPQVTATVDCASARDLYYKQTGRYVPIITDGGMSAGGDVCKAFVAGANAVVVGSAFARAEEAPGHGFHWGMATSHENLPRGTRVKVNTTGTLKQILYGPADLDDGSQNLVGALKLCMGSTGSKNIRALNNADLVIAPAIKSEGKVFQQQQAVGMGK